ncbi:MAG: class I SAM-dependent methyltransferase [Methanomassiliicoccus sp.]|nr:class I SAM-dependent methyltransferase [Methanomassiliicoccus sp.]
MDKDGRMDQVRSNFSGKAREYDERITKIIPRYTEMLGVLVSCIVPPEGRRLRVIDIGCGTGALSMALLRAHPDAELTCLDMTENMLDIARERLGHHRDARFVLADLYDFEFEGPYDVVMSSLALHHLVTDHDKREVYRKIHDALRPGGQFFNADIVLGSDEEMQEMYMTRWKEFMYLSFPKEEIDHQQVPRYRREDSPARLVDHLLWLNEAGFRGADVVWKYFNFAVYGGRR